MRCVITTCVVFLTSLSVAAQEYEGMEDYGSLRKQAEEYAPADGRKILETGRDMTLVKQEILPGSCWDYANAVYERAGYSWGQRENVYKTVKAGP